LLNPFHSKYLEWYSPYLDMGYTTQVCRGEMVRVVSYYTYGFFSVACRPTPLILDEEGRTIDAMTGQAVQLQHHTPTLKVLIEVLQWKVVDYQLKTDFRHLFSRHKFLI